MDDRVELPPVEQWAIVTAQRPGAYGFAKVGRRHRDVETITLTQDETVTVRVTGGDDRTVAATAPRLLEWVGRRYELVNGQRLAVGRRRP